MSEWTKEPWIVAQPWAGFSEIRGAGGELVFGLAAGVEHERQPEEVCEANAARLQAAVNFCAGITIPENVTAGELVEALQNAMGHLDTPIGRRKLGLGTNEPWVMRARALLTAFKGDSHG